ncbi:MAG: hypothetical protein H6723_01510 [Sandaracinus sp.]|nr:hypothetical protein [Sandaracinus sp.]
MLRRLALAPLALLLACSSSSEPGLCGSDGYHQVVDGANVCAYAQAIVIEGGFRCPASLPFRLDLDGAAICSDRMFSRDDLPDDLCRRVDRTCGRDGGRSDAGMGDDAGSSCSTADEPTPVATRPEWRSVHRRLVTSAPRHSRRWGLDAAEVFFRRSCFECGDEGERVMQETEYCEVSPVAWRLASPTHQATDAHGV